MLGKKPVIELQQGRHESVPDWSFYGMCKEISAGHWLGK